MTPPPPASNERPGRSTENTASASVKPAQVFTPETANQALPLVRAIVTDLTTLYQDVNARQERLRGLNGRRRRVANREITDPYVEEVADWHRTLDRDVDRMQDYVDELSSLGVSVQDPATGSVKFPAIINGSPASLSWQLGEPQVEYWLEAEETFGGRKLLPSEE